MADPRTANLLRISSARAGGSPTVQGLRLPEQIGALFGLEPGQELPSGVQGEGVASSLDTATRPKNRFEVIGDQIAEARAKGDLNEVKFLRDQQIRLFPGGPPPGTPLSSEPTATPTAAPGSAGGILGSIGQILNQASSFQSPQLQSQLTPGTARNFSPEELGAAQAAFIGSGTSLEEQQRKARGSALPGGFSIRSR